VETALVKVTGNENVKEIFFMHIFFKSSSIYAQPKAKWWEWSMAHSTQIVNTFHQWKENDAFCENL